MRNAATAVTLAQARPNRTQVRDRHSVASGELRFATDDSRSVRRMSGCDLRTSADRGSVSLATATDGVAIVSGADTGVDPWPAGFTWGEPWQIGTAAFWVDQCRQAEDVSLRLGEDLREEVVACLLGGWGVPGDVGVAAFDRLRQEGLLTHRADAELIEAALRAPFTIPGRRRAVRYRFPSQRAVRIVGAIALLESADPPSAPLPLRDWLADHVPGVGLKTASWIVRNLAVEAPIAVIDIHVHRAGLGAGFFDSEWQLPRDYYLFEAAFVEVARRGKVRPGKLDHAVWSTLSAAPSHTRPLLCGNCMRISE